MPACKRCSNMFGPDWGSGLCFDCREDLERARSGEGWRDESHDRWGRKQADGARWKGGNCLAAAIASMLGVSEIMAVPNPVIEYSQGLDVWMEAYNERLSNACGVRLEELPKSLCPPRDRSLWIAVIELSGEAHAVVCRENYVWHDPASAVQGQLNLNDLIKGFQLVRTHRVVPNLGRGYSLVPA